MAEFLERKLMMNKDKIGRPLLLITFILLLLCDVVLLGMVNQQKKDIQQLAIMSPDEVGIFYIQNEEILSAKFDSSNPNFNYVITDYSIVTELLNSLDSAVFQKCDKPIDVDWLEMLYISTSENEYIIGVESGIFKISINGVPAYYRCSKKADFIEKLCELQGR